MQRYNCLVWYRNDLRVRDHAPLLFASNTYRQVYPVFVIDPDWFVNGPLGFPKYGAVRSQFLLESLINLKELLRKINSDLIVKIGKPQYVLPILCKELKANEIIGGKEIGQEEEETESWLRQNLPQSVTLRLLHNFTLYDPETLPFPIKILPDVFTDFKKKVEKLLVVKKPYPIPKELSSFPEKIAGAIPTLADLGIKEKPVVNIKAAMKFKGGESAAWARIKHYFWDSKSLSVYKQTRNGLLGADYSSKLSPWLAFGCISARSVYQEIQKYESKIAENDSTYWLFFELIWRDYFKFVALKYGKKIFMTDGIRKSETVWKQDKEQFEKWCNGETGVPFVDANMRELLLTGFMSNRGRQNVASYLAKDLNIDWTWGAAWFESRLIDYDVCSNWGNWMYVAGVGNDPRETRYFNIEKQAKEYDPKGEFVKHWLD